MQNPYSLTYRSTVRAVSDLVKDVKNTLANQSEAKYRDWENRGDEDQLDRVTLIGVNGFTFDENEGQWIIRFGVTLSTVDDENLMDEADIIDIAHKHFGFQKKVALRDETGAQISELLSVNFQVQPMEQTQMRNYRTIGVELLKTRND